MEKLQEEIKQFVEARGWTGNKDPRNLAISISLEASELLEHFQWQCPDKLAKNKRDDIAEEAADVLIYLLQLADVLQFDLEAAAYQKLKKNDKRFPLP